MIEFYFSFRLNPKSVRNSCKNLVNIKLEYFNDAYLVNSRRFFHRMTSYFEVNLNSI